MLLPRAQYRTNPNVRCRFLREWGVAIAYSPEIRAVLAVDPFGYLIWKLCDRARSPEDILSIALGWFQDGHTSGDTIAEHVRLALDMLTRSRMLLPEDDHDLCWGRQVPWPS